MIGDYVRAGGGFAMIGGWMSFGGFHGKAQYAYSPLAKLLPVRSIGTTTAWRRRKAFIRR